MAKGIMQVTGDSHSFLTLHQLFNYLIRLIQLFLQLLIPIHGPHSERTNQHNNNKRS
ncbi:hypothetical protein D3C75_484360 [compost metagenome]